MISLEYKCIGLYPNPFAQDEWTQKGNRHHRALADAYAEAGWKVIGLGVGELLNVEYLVSNGIKYINVHWTETISREFLSFSPWDRVNGKIHRTFSQLSLQMTRHRISRWVIQLSKYNINIIQHVHELTAHGLDHDPVWKACDDFLKEQLYRHCIGFITQEASSIPYIYSFYRQKKAYAIAPIGDYSIFHGQDISQKQAKANLNINLTRRVVAYVGTARANRNPKEIIQAFLEMHQEQDLLLLAGNGISKYMTNQEKYHQQIKSIDGLLSDHQLRDVFCAADFIVNDARSYLTSGVLRTAMSYSTPVICYRYGAAIDMVDGAAIWLDDYKSLKDGLRIATESNKEAYKDMVLEAKERNHERPWSRSGEALNRLVAASPRRVSECPAIIST